MERHSSATITRVAMLLALTSPSCADTLQRLAEGGENNNNKKDTSVQAPERSEAEIAVAKLCTSVKGGVYIELEHELASGVEIVRAADVNGKNRDIYTYNKRWDNIGAVDGGAQGVKCRYYDHDLQDIEFVESFFAKGDVPGTADAKKAGFPEFKPPFSFVAGLNGEVEFLIERDKENYSPKVGLQERETQAILQARFQKAVAITLKRFDRKMMLGGGMK
jgi:hypothetical protein